MLVKADCEGNEGPQSFNKTEADGANMLARALKPIEVGCQTFIIYIYFIKCIYNIATLVFRSWFLPRQAQDSNGKASKTTFHKTWTCAVR